MRHKRTVCAGIAVCAIFAIATFAQQKPDKTPSIHVSKPWTGGSPEEAQAASKAGGTIPLSTYSIIATKDPLPRSKKPQSRTGTIVGTNPFATSLSGATIFAVLVPVVIKIGSVTFDPAAPSACDAGVSAVDRFNASPLVQPVPGLSFNGVNVGDVQYVDGFMRAEFWNATGGNPAYANPISFTTLPAATIDATAYGTITRSGCATLGVVYEASLGTQLRALLQSLTQSGAVSTTKVVFFLVNSVAQSTVNPPSLPGSSGCCIGGYHTATGSPPQFWAIMDYEATGTLSANDIAISSHEIAEFMNDPLGNNQTPAWGGIGQVAAGSCQGNLEVGDPLTRTNFPLSLNGYSYHPQELAFFSWFFNAPGTASLGAGGKFSSGGTFGGPSQACPPGGTY